MPTIDFITRTTPTPAASAKAIILFDGGVYYNAIDGTPVLDIKPHMSGFAPRGALREPAWVNEIMKDYW